tara:strand:+ start:1667 stop:2332 length:666 start_codon:yes stop_codon:yes gene_type:complete
MGIFRRLFGRTLYYPGCVPKHMLKDVQRRHEHLLTMFNIDYIKIPDMELCCGKPALESGHKDVFKDVVRRNKELFANQGVKTIVTSCPKCYYMFKKFYDVEVKLISELVLENLEEIKKRYSEEVYIFDPCNPYDFDEVYEMPRQILKSLGFSVKEFMYSKGQSLCCGQPIKDNSPKVSEEMAKQRLGGVKAKIITMCPSCYGQLKQNNPNVEVLELSEVLI